MLKVEIVWFMTILVSGSLKIQMLSTKLSIKMDLTIKLVSMHFPSLSEYKDNNLEKLRIIFLQLLITKITGILLRKDQRNKKILSIISLSKLFVKRISTK